MSVLLRCALRQRALAPVRSAGGVTLRHFRAPVALRVKNSGPASRGPPPAAPSSSGSSAGAASAKSNGASSTSSSSTGASAAGTGSAATAAATAAGLPDWQAVARLSPHGQADLFNSLPMFRHTCTGPPFPTWSNSSLTCEGLVREESVHAKGALASSVMVSIQIMMQLSQYVQVADSPTDVLMGVQEAHLVLVDCFNTFHLAKSRTHLKSLCTPQVYRALENTWTLLDSIGLRMQYRMAVREVQLLNLNVHDSDEFMEGGSGGGGGLTVPVAPDVPFSAGSGAARKTTPSSSKTDSMSVADGKPTPTPKVGGGVDATPPPGQKLKPAADKRAVRYADLDAQVCVFESFELWTIRPDQKLDLAAAPETAAAPAADAAAPASGKKDAASAASTPVDPVSAAAAAALTSSSSSSLDAERDADEIVDNFTLRLDMLHDLSMAQRQLDLDASSASAGSASVVGKDAKYHETVVQDILADLAKASSIDGLFEKKMEIKTSAGGVASIDAITSASSSSPIAAAAAAAAATSSSSAASSTSSSSSSSTPSTPPPHSSSSSSIHPPDGDWPPPLNLLTTISGEGERGLRFWTSLPAKTTEMAEGLYIIPSVVPGQSSSSSSSSSEGSAWGMDALREQALKWAKTRMPIHPKTAQAPKPSWIIKDILD